TSWLPLGNAVAPLDGPGPNPLLQNHILMAVHPPLLYIGYVGFTVPFAFAISAMARGDRGKVWLDRTHRWGLVAWSFLTLGILLGAWWSYEVLGWGGYWAWDPVENAAFLPWLIGTAFIHSAVVQRRRGMLQAWNLVLVISTFALTIFGTFLTRSGTIASVHAFSLSPVGPALLAFLGVVIVGSFALFAARSHLVASSPRLDSLASREGAFLFQNLLLTIFGFTVLLGTLWPLFVEAFQGRDVSVGRPFFDRATLPIAFALLLAMGLGPITPYRSARASVVWARVELPLQIALGGGVLAILIGVRSVPTIVVIVLALFVVAVAVRQLGTQVRRRMASGERPGVALRRVVVGDSGYWGGQIAHVGFALLAVGIAASTSLALREQVTLQVNESQVVGDYCVGYLGAFSRTEANRTVEGAEVVLMEDDCSTEIARMFPRVNRYPVFTQGAVATPDVRSGLVEDVYLSLAGVSGGTLFLDVFVFPLMWVLWLGGMLVVAGGMFSFFVRRRSKREAPQRAAPMERRG
ncbi:MAG: heme lyase CcmF/NrfE family subunit, partial [Acidimicrobiia bacterium]